MRQLEQKAAYAIAYLNYKFPHRPEIAERFFQLYTRREKLMVMRVVIGGRNAESLQGAAQQLGMDGLFTSFSFEDQNVRRVYLRMNEKLEDMRLNAESGGIEKILIQKQLRR